MYSSKVWELVKASNEIKPIKYKWICKTKRRVDGRMKMLKARLLVKLHTQKEGIDYKEIFSSTVMRKSIKILLSIVVVLDYEI